MTGRTHGPPADGAPTPCSGGTCDVWWARLHPVDDLLHLLSYGERHNSATFRDAGERSRYVTARALLRLLLAEQYHIDPPLVPIGRMCRVCQGRNHGKPYLIGMTCPTRFSIAHAGEWVAVAMTTARSVGVDIEPVHDDADPQRLALAREALAPVERSHYTRLDPDDRARAMTQWWTRKEAVLKATGEGLAVPPSALLVSAPDQPPAVLGWDTHRAPAALGRFRGIARLEDVAPAEGYVGCVALLGPAPIVVRMRDGDLILERPMLAGLAV